MIPEAEIESAIAAKVAAALTGHTVRIVKSWEALAAGEVKGTGDATAAVVAIAVGIRSYASFCTPQADLPCSLILSVRRDADPTGSTFAALAEPILALLHSWNGDYDTVFTDLATAQFSVGGFQLTGGGKEQTEDTLILSLDFTIRGVIEQTTSTDGQAALDQNSQTT